jgi:hypothetical protein
MISPCLSAANSGGNVKMLFITPQPSRLRRLGWEGGCVCLDIYFTPGLAALRQAAMLRITPSEYGAAFCCHDGFVVRVNFLRN